MKIYNRKLAQRIAENLEELRYLNGRYGVSTTNPVERAELDFLRARVDADTETLQAAGYDIKGKRVAPRHAESLVQKRS